MCQQSVDVERIHLQRGENLSYDTSLAYPVAMIDGLKIHLERNFFGITLKELPEKDTFVNRNVTASTNVSYPQLVSNLQFVKVSSKFQIVKYRYLLDTLC